MEVRLVHLLSGCYIYSNGGSVSLQKITPEDDGDTWILDAGPVGTPWRTTCANEVAFRRAGNDGTSLCLLGDGESLEYLEYLEYLELFVSPR